MQDTYRATSHLKRGKEITAADQCYACNKFFVEKKSLENHLKTCSSMPGITENQTVQTFFDNMKFMGNVPIPI